MSWFKKHDEFSKQKKEHISINYFMENCSTERFIMLIKIEKTITIEEPPMKLISKNHHRNIHDTNLIFFPCVSNMKNHLKIINLEDKKITKDKIKTVFYQKTNKEEINYLDKIKKSEIKDTAWELLDLVR